MKTITGSIKQTASSALKSVQEVPKIARRQSEWLLATTQGLLASSLASDLNGVIGRLVEGAPTIYDKAMDAQFIATHVGGSFHRLFDGGHTLFGAFKSVRDASPDDTIVQEAIGLVQGLIRDMATPRGLPIVNWDKDSYYATAEFLSSKLGISKAWFHEINTYDAANLLGATLGAVAVVFCWNRADTESFARLVSGMGVAAIARTNPLLMVVTTVALARSFAKARQTGEWAQFADGQIKGAITSGATIASVAMVGTLSGPAGLALLVGMVVGILAHKATEKVSVIEIGDFAAEKACQAAEELQDMTASFQSEPKIVKPSVIEQFVTER